MQCYGRTIPGSDEIVERKEPLPPETELISIEKQLAFLDLKGETI